MTGQGDDYTTGCLLDYDYIKFVWQLRKLDNRNANVDSVFILTN